MRGDITDLAACIVDHPDFQGYEPAILNRAEASARALGEGDTEWLVSSLSELVSEASGLRKLAKGYDEAVLAVERYALPLLVYCSKASGLDRPMARPTSIDLCVRGALNNIEKARKSGDDELFWLAYFARGALGRMLPDAFIEGANEILRGVRAAFESNLKALTDCLENQGWLDRDVRAGIYMLRDEARRVRELAARVIQRADALRDNYDDARLIEETSEMYAELLRKTRSLIREYETLVKTLTASLREKLSQAGSVPA